MSESIPKHAPSPVLRRIRRAAVAVAAAAAVVVVPVVTATPAHAEKCYGSDASCIAWGVGSAPRGIIYRDEVVSRAKQWINHKSITYSMSHTAYGPGGWGKYRRDCSGFVSMALHYATGGPSYGLNTVSLRDHVTAIKWSSLKRGDLLGVLGKGTGGEFGHVQLFWNWANSSHTKVTVAEQGGLGSVPNYPHLKTYTVKSLKLDNGAVFKPYRYKNIR